MGQLEAIYPQLQDLGYQLIAISPDEPGMLCETTARYGFSYQFLSDRQTTAAKAFGLAFRLSVDMVERYRRQGIDIEAASGANHHILPVPAVFVIGRDGVLAYSYVNPNYKHRMHPEVILAAAKVVVDE